MHTLALIMLFVSFFGIPFFLLLAVIQFFRGKSSKTLFMLSIGLVPVLIVGIVLGELTTPSYWEKDEQTAAEREENKKIQENISRNWDAVEKEKAEYEKAQHQEMKDTLGGPEEIRTNAKNIDFERIQNDSDSYIGEYIKFEGTINEIREVEKGIGSVIALNVGEGNLVRVKTVAPVNFVAGDYITVYGTFTGLFSYTSSSGDKVYSPDLTADMIE